MVPPVRPLVLLPRRAVVLDRGPGSLVSRDPYRRAPRRRWKGLPGSWRDPWTYAVLFDPGRADPPGRCSEPMLSPLIRTGTTFGDNLTFEARSHGLRPRCLRFAGALAVPPTQDSLLAGGQPLPGGIHTRRVPFRRFPTLSTGVCIVFLLHQAWPGALCPPPVVGPCRSRGRGARVQ